MYIFLYSKLSASTAETRTNRFRDRCSRTHIGWTKITPCTYNMLCTFALKYLLRILHVSKKSYVRQTHDSVCEI